jgi:hypothetical protein
MAESSLEKQIDALQDDVMDKSNLRKTRYATV